MTVRDAYLGAAGAAVGLIGQRAVGDRWDEPSVLGGMLVGALAGHLARAVLQVEWFLDMPEPEPPTVSAAAYYAELAGTADPESELNVGVRARAEETAEGGWARLYLDVLRAHDRLAERLPEVPSERRLAAFGRALTVDDYLRTRCVELVVHIDDLARSLDLRMPAIPDEATATAIWVLVGAARVRHGDLAVLHALVRRERDAVEALRVL